MIFFHRLILLLCLTIVLPINAFSYAPVVDDSENFALLEEQQAAVEQPVARQPRDDIAYNDEQPALARETATSEDSANNVGLVNKIQGLQQDIQELRGQLEVQSHDLKLLQDQQLSFYKDLDERLRTGTMKMAKSTPPTDLSQTTKSAMPQSAAAPTPAPQAVSQATSIEPVVVASTSNNPADEQISYLAAYELVKNKHFDEALVAMQAFVAKYPHGGYTANAQYWLGELYMVQKNYSQAIDHFDQVLEQFPSSSKCSASMLKIGYALAASGKKAQARERLQEVLKKYPDTSTAQLASTKLESLGG